jgi:hypothetical protein
MPFVAGSLGQSFKRGANETAHRLAVWNQLQKEKETDRKAKTDQMDNQTDIIDLAMNLATTEQIEIFQSRLDVYDAATVEALQRNTEALEALEEKMEPLLDNAYQLEDGRRVFKTRDGTQVFDENGQAVSRSDVDPNDIHDGYTNWDVFKPYFHEKVNLMEDRQKIHEFQDNLDHARDRSDVKGFTQKELNELDDELKDMMPDTVKVGVPDMQSDISRDKDMSTRLEISADMVPQGMAPPSM